MIGQEPGPGAFPWFFGEPFSGDPSVSPGLARPIGWRVRRPDGTAAWDKVGPLDTDWLPVGGGTTPTLAQVYAAGAAPSTDDLMGMTQGTTARFQANGDASPLPLIGLYETAASKVNSNIGNPSIGQSLAVNLATLIGSRIFNGYELFDPLWTGDWAQLDHYSWEIETVSFQQDPAISWRRTDSLGLRFYEALKNYQPESTPPGPPNTGPVAMVHTLRLFDTLDGNRQTIQQLDAFGQERRQIAPINQGQTYALSLHFKSDLVVDHADNGTGIAVYDGDIDHGGAVPQAAFSFRTVGAATAGDWYGAISLKDTGGTGLLSDVAVFQRGSVLVNGPKADPTGGFIQGLGAFSDAPAGTINLFAANKDATANASANLFFLCGSWDGSAGASSTFTLNSPAASGTNGGPQAFLFTHAPTVPAPIIFWNQTASAGSDIVFRVGFNSEVLRFVQAGAVVQIGASGIHAPGGTAVTISNSPGASATPTEYWAVKNASGQVRYIPLLA